MRSRQRIVRARDGLRASAKASPWSPSLLTGLSAWYRGDQFASTGGEITSAADLSGGAIGALSQGTGAQQPTYSASLLNGQAGATFAGAQWLFAGNANMAGTTGLTIAAVFRFGAMSASFRALIAQQYNANHYALATPDGSLLQFRIATGSGTPVTVTLNSDAAMGTGWHKVVCRYDGATLHDAVARDRGSMFGIDSTLSPCDTVAIKSLLGGGGRCSKLT